MAQNLIGQGPVDKTASMSPDELAKQGEFSQDVEVGPEMVDIDRIEQVYR
jgi:hypothetical protein